MPKQRLELEIVVDEKGAVSDIRKVNTAVKKTTQDTAAGAKQQAGILSKLKSSWLGVVAGIGASVIAIKKIIGLSKDFQFEIAKVASVSGVARKELEEIARTAGKTTVFSAKEAAQALFELGKAGLKTADDMRNALNPSLRLAIAGELSLAEATSTVVKTVSIFGLRMADSARVVDVLAQAANSSVTSVGELSQAMKFAGPIAKLVGLNVENTAAIMALMANNGINATMAGTSLRMALLRLAKPTSEARSVLAKYNISLSDLKNSLDDPVKLFNLLRPAVQNASDAQALLGVRSSALAGVINKSNEEISAMVDLMDNAGGAAEALEKERLNTLQGAVLLLKSAFQELILSGTGDGGLIDMATDIIKALRNLIILINKAPPAVKGLVIAISALIPAFIALSVAMGPIGAILTLLGAATAIAVGSMIDLNKETEDLTENLTELDDKMTDIIAASGDLDAQRQKEIKTNQALIAQNQKAIEVLGALEKRTAGLNAQEQKNLSLTNEEIQVLTAFNKEIKSAADFRKVINRLLAENVKLTKQNNDLRKVEGDAVSAQVEDLEKLIKLKDDLLKLTTTEQDKLKANIANVNKVIKANIAEGDELDRLKILRTSLNDQLAAENKIREDLTKTAMSMGIAEEELTNLTKDQIDKRIQALQKEKDTRRAVADKIFDLTSQTANATAELFSVFAQGAVDTRNVYSEQLAALDEEDKQRNIEKLKNEIETLKSSGDAEDQALAEEKERELNRAQLEQQAAARDKKIKRDQAIAARKVAIVERVAAVVSIVANTAKSIMGLWGTPPFNLFALPAKVAMAVTIGAIGAAQAVAALAAPLPPVPAFQRGGTLGGSSLTGDRTTFAGNRGETIVNTQQGQNLFNALSDAGLLTGQTTNNIQNVRNSRAGDKIIQFNGPVSFGTRDQFDNFVDQRLAAGGDFA